MLGQGRIPDVHQALASLALIKAPNPLAGTKVALPSGHVHTGGCLSLGPLGVVTRPHHTLSIDSDYPIARSGQVSPEQRVAASTL